MVVSQHTAFQNGNDDNDSLSESSFGDEDSMSHSVEWSSSSCSSSSVGWNHEQSHHTYSKEKKRNILYHHDCHDVCSDNTIVCDTDDDYDETMEHWLCGSTSGILVDYTTIGRAIDIVVGRMTRFLIATIQQQRQIRFPRSK